MESTGKASEIFLTMCPNFKKACELYKWMLDRHFGQTFCTSGYCRTVFMVEVTADGQSWEASPKRFYSEKEAQMEIEY